MPRLKDPDNPRHEEPRPRRHRAGRDRVVHVAITERRFAGGPAPTHEAYTAALEQWHQLPGSIVRPATDLLLMNQPTTAAQDPTANFPSGIPGNEEPKQ